MYLPPIFESTTETAHELLREYPFATVVGSSGTDDDLEVLHVPLLVEDGGEGGTVRICGHVARANPFVKLIAREAKVTAVFHGPDAYVSASLYERPREEVPTWNYAVVHVRGQLRLLDDAALIAQLITMVERFERGPDRWTPELLQPDFFAELRRGIVGFAIDVKDIRAKLKLSQNRSPADRGRVEVALGASAQQRDRDVAILMKRAATQRQHNRA